MTDTTTDETLAAVDLGSNSFHMIVARFDGHQLRIVDRLREPVRLGGGIDPRGHLDAATRDRALACLERFGQRIREVAPGHARAVGTNTLRNMAESAPFLAEAARALGHPVEVISGIEEARLIYLGVARALAPGGTRLVMDIGGGSTELILGRGNRPDWMESLELGCVTLTRRFFGDGAIDRCRVEAARLQVARELAPLVRQVQSRGWEEAVGASGTIRACGRVVAALGHGERLTPAALRRLIDHCIEAGHSDRIALAGVSEERRPVFIGGLVILSTTLELLAIDAMAVSDGALREGLLLDLIGRLHHDDVRPHSVAALARRHHADPEQGQRVATTALRLFDQCAPGWELDGEARAWLEWAAELHEIGLDIAHARHHHHGAYIVANADLAGFSRQEQALLALLLQNQRRRFRPKRFRTLPRPVRTSARRLAILLRLAILFHRDRAPAGPPPVTARGEDDHLTLTLPAGWLERHPLTRADLEQEREWLADAGFTLRIETA